MLTLNSKYLKDQFVITKDSDKMIMGEGEEPLQQKEGVEEVVFVSVALTVQYFDVEMKLLSFYKRQNKDKNTLLDALQKSVGIDDKQMVGLKSNSKSESDDMKNLKDFKNFISIKSQPSAISRIKTICLLLMLILTCSIVALIVNWSSATNTSSMMISTLKMNVLNGLITPEMLSQLQKFYISAQSPHYSGVNINTAAMNLTVANASLTAMIELIKQN